GVGFSSLARERQAGDHELRLAPSRARGRRERRLVTGPEEGRPPPSTDAGRQRGAPDSSDTVEADTLSLADREEAEEAALAGLRARTEAQTTKTDQRVAAATTPAAAPPP